MTLLSPQMERHLMVSAAFLDLLGLGIRLVFLLLPPVSFLLLLLLSLSFPLERKQKRLAVTWRERYSRGKPPVGIVMNKDKGV